MPQAKKQLGAGTLSSKQTNAREQAVLNEGGSRCASILWDFAEEGGAQADYSLGRKLPAGAIVTRCTADTQTDVTGGADFLVSAGATALTTAAALTTAGLTTLSLPANAVKVSTESELKITIGTADATAGKVRFFVEYLLPND